MEIVTATPFPPALPLRAAIRASCRIDESEAVARILAAVVLPAEMRDRIADRARAFLAAMRIVGRQFVIGRTIEEAIEHAREAERHGYRHSYDMLGEAAHTAADAARYFEAYEHAIAVIGRSAANRDIAEAPGISVKLSAFHPRYEMAQRDRVLQELSPRRLDLACQARQAGIGFTIDAG